MWVWVHGLLAPMVLVVLILYCFYKRSEKDLASDWITRLYCKNKYDMEDMGFVGLMAIIVSGFLWLIISLIYRTCIDGKTYNTQGTTQEYVDVIIQSFKTGWQLGNTIRNILIVCIIVGFIILYYVAKKNTAIDKALREIEISIKELRNSYYIINQQEKDMIKVLEASRDKIKRQKANRIAYRGIKAAMNVQKMDGFDIQKEIDTLNALYELDERELKSIESKYK